MSQKLVVVYFKVLYRHLPGGTEEKYKTPQSGWSNVLFELRT